MTDFKPEIITEPSKWLELNLNKKFVTGDKYCGVGDVIFADNDIVKICYYRGTNCDRCSEACPFNRNPSKKEG